MGGDNRQHGMFENFQPKRGARITSAARLTGSGRAGMPATVSPGGTDRVTTAPAATTQPSPSSTSLRITAFAPTQQPLPITTRPLSIGDAAGPVLSAIWWLLSVM